jgi:hypothetical protein
MRWARLTDHPDDRNAPASISEMMGQRECRREERNSAQQKKFRDVLRDVAADTFVQERQARDDEVRLHRELAEELIDIGYRALATKLHPDRGGSKGAMARLNCVRDELKDVATGAASTPRNAAGRLIPSRENFCGRRRAGYVEAVGERGG